ncbi:MAG TPA: SAM-dependent methyltransferase, partial [Candidatus Binatia bacterium]|nr:SAM-dependent methyltransferase [Candidatus Binatia bacterium]
VFEGFLPSRPGPRAARLAALAREPRALVFFEAARRLAAFLAAAEEALGDRDVVLARELTKRHEEILRGRLAELRQRVRDVELRGEVTVLIAGAPETALAEAQVDVDADIRAARAAGQGLRELSAAIARRTGLPRREVYRRALALDRLRTDR